MGCNIEVQGKVEAKKDAFAKWVDYMVEDKEEKQSNRESYKVARVEAKVVVTTTKASTFE